MPSVIVTNVAAKSRGGEVDLSFEAIVNLKGVSEKTICVVSAIETGAPKEENDFAISLYIVQKGETLWDVAKALNTSEEILLRQNADVPLPLSGGEKVILYRELPFDR
ncbi:MAG: LysM peptidoglycan-binding domain-containing protein [Clostridia bacterium]|nr:LysM peptidoglycan-binding domain-containing protein [Clostridia bacterium]